MTVETFLLWQYLILQTLRKDRIPVFAKTCVMRIEELAGSGGQNW
jgi:hypothetical protein